MSMTTTIATRRKWLLCLITEWKHMSGSEPEFFDEMSMAVMEIIETLRCKRLQGEDTTIESIAEVLLDPDYGGDGEERLTPTEHRTALAMMAATAINFLVNDKGTTQ